MSKSNPRIACQDVPLRNSFDLENRSKPWILVLLLEVLYGGGVFKNQSFRKKAALLEDEAKWSEVNRNIS